VPDAVAIEAWAKAEGITGRDLMAEPKVRRLLEQEVDKYSKDFKGFERIKDFVIDTEELSTQNGMLTPTLKLKRRNVMTKYGAIFESLYPAAASNRPEPRASYIRELRPLAQRAQANGA
jgi:long-chain acyl-CoA synthetase